MLYIRNFKSSITNYLTSLSEWYYYTKFAEARRDKKRLKKNIKIFKDMLEDCCFTDYTEITDFLLIYIDNMLKKHKEISKAWSSTLEYDLRVNPIQQEIKKSEENYLHQIDVVLRRIQGNLEKAKYAESAIYHELFFDHCENSTEFSKAIKTQEELISKSYKCAFADLGIHMKDLWL